MNTMAGRIDYSRLALDAELQRLRRFEDRLRKFEPEELNARNGIDLRILQAAIANELFEFQACRQFERNPMIYARCADLNIYIKRNFAPLEDRVRSTDRNRRPDPEHPDRRQNQSRGGFAQALRRTRNPDRTRFG